MYADPMLVGLLEGIRARFMQPVNVYSWCRCAAHNETVGGEKGSFHLTGQAADISIDGVSLDDLAAVAEELGADGIGMYYDLGFVHVDVRGYMARW
jgi:uncharacterized protein YcbK (DUF882 family)